METFEADRRAAQDAAIEDVRPAIEESLEQRDTDVEEWTAAAVAAAAVLYLAAFEAETPDVPVVGAAEFSALVTLMLETATVTDPGPDRDDQVERLALWLGVAALNAATFHALTYADLDTAGVEWVTMGDDVVRHTHREVAGEQRRFGATFDVGGYDLRYPGEPVGPPEIWIGCRCSLRRVRMREEATLTTTTAAVNEHTAPDYAGGMVALKPTSPEEFAVEGGDPASELHVTLAFLGDDVSVFADGDLTDLQDVAGAMATALGAPRKLTVSGVGRLGSSEPPATVLLLNVDGDDLLDVQAAVRDWVEARPDGHRQYRPWTPHMTLGYGLDPNDYQEFVGREVLVDRIDVHLGGDVTTHALAAGDAAVEEPPEVDEAPVEETPWYSVLAPEGIPSGDRRMFAPNTMRWRDLPLPLLWQKASADGHDNAVVVGRIDEIWRDGSLLKAKGVFNETTEADEVVGLISDRHLRGVSVDVDDAEMELGEYEGQDMAVISGRIAAATIVPIPAFAEAFIQLGAETDETDDVGAEETDDEVTDDAEDVMFAVELAAYAISEGSWDGSASRFTPEQWRRSTVLDTGQGDEGDKSRYKLPIREPNGDLSRAGVHAAAARFNQVEASDQAKAAARRKLRAAYSQLDEDPPEVLQAAAGTEEFRRGPGWVTHPEETRRLHNYWIRGPGAAKVQWGTTGSFRRCRRLLAEYLPPQYLNRTCAEWYHDATGRWPGVKRGDKASTEGGVSMNLIDVESALVASAAVVAPPAEWFRNPGLTEPTPLTLSDCGQVYGHVAVWSQCHVGVPGCRTAPHTQTDYAYFHLGLIRTEEGTDIPCGQITLGGGHANIRLGMQAAMAHYDDVATAVADIVVGEDEVGIWCAGALRPGLSEETMRELRGAKLSGDWRTIRGSDEMMAVHCVNMAGIPIPRMKVGFSGGHQTALVAAGIVMDDPREITIDDIVDITMNRIEAKNARADRLRGIKARVSEQRAQRLAAIRERVGAKG